MTYPTEGKPADQAAVATLAQQMIAAWAYHDADGFAELFTEDGTMVLPGEYRQGREEIREYFKHAFENEYKGTQVSGKPISLRFFGTDAALLLSSGGVLASGESALSDAQAVRASWFAVRHNGQWKLAAYMNTPAKQKLPTPGA